MFPCSFYPCVVSLHPSMHPRWEGRRHKENMQVRETWMQLEWDVPCVSPCPVPDCLVTLVFHVSLEFLPCQPSIPWEPIWFPSFWEYPNLSVFCLFCEPCAFLFSSNVFVIMKPALSLFSPCLFWVVHLSPVSRAWALVSACVWFIMPRLQRHTEKSGMQPGGSYNGMLFTLLSFPMTPSTT